LSELFCAVFSTAVVHNDMYIYEQFLQLTVDLGFSLIFFMSVVINAI